MSYRRHTLEIYLDDELACWYNLPKALAELRAFLVFEEQGLRAEWPE
jgi:hypothetical protein